VSVIRQLSLFGADSAQPQPDDLAGLLTCGGQLTRLGGTTRVSIVVDHPWRAAALVAECGRRGLAATSVATADENVGVRTAYSVLLTPLAEAWTRGAVIRVPGGLLLDGRMLRLWAQACGYAEGPSSYVLGLARVEALWQPLGAALAAVGLGAQFVTARGSGPSYRIVGRRRLSRLVEMLGDPPKQAPVGSWPS
jgi:hypothetical protein